MKSQKRLSSGHLHLLAVSALLLATLLLFPEKLSAKSVTAQHAQKAVKGFLSRCPNPLQTPLGLQLDTVDTFSDDDGQALYYVVYLKPCGFVIVPADDLVEPIIAFASDGTYDPSPQNPLGALVTNDLANRIAAARMLQQTLNEHGNKSSVYNTALQEVAQNAHDKWQTLIQFADEEQTIQPLDASDISDVRVAPLIQSTWGQTTVGDYIGGITCYNYYTPYGTSGDRCPCGCVATAMAQLMRYHQYPTDYVGAGSYFIEIEGEPNEVEVSLFGGPYQWSDMPLVPDNNITLLQRQAIGEICYDAGVSVNMSYTSTGSGASLHDTDIQLVERFDYSNCIFGYNNNSEIGNGITKMINPNLDACLPVILGVHNAGGHAVICDGYGYNFSTLYHHLNMGWSGFYDAWYDLPIVDTNFYDFDVVDTCLYNIFTSGSGEIISGRITDAAGIPLGGVTVTANGGAYSATTNQNGIYALVNVPSNTTFAVNAASAGWSFDTQYATTGKSVDDSKISGNVWAVDFQGSVSGGLIQFEKDVYVVPENLTVRLINSDLKGAGSADVLMKICEGDCETLAVFESPADSGIFFGAIPTAEGTPTREDGIMQITQSRVVIAEYQDTDGDTANTATLRDTAILTVLDVLLQEDFSTGIPDTWSVVNDGGDHTWQPADADDWLTREDWDGTLTGDFVVVDSDSAYDEDMDEQLITPALNCSKAQTVTLRFKHQFVYYWTGSDEIADVDIQINSGSWQNLACYEENTSGWVELDLTSIAAGRSAVRIRWHYYNANYEYYWGIDDVSVTAVTAPQVTGGDFEPDCDVDLEDFNTLASAWLSDPDDNNWDGRCDISDPGDSIIDGFDLEVFSENWLWR